MRAAPPASKSHGFEQFYDFAAGLAAQYIVTERGEISQRGRGENMEADGVRALISF